MPPPLRPRPFRAGGGGWRWLPAFGQDPGQRRDVQVYALLILLFAAVLLAGCRGSPLARPLFVAGSVTLAWQAWRIRPGLHAEILIVLFAFVPFLRRVVDSHAGFDASGAMLAGPLLALAVPLPELRLLLRQRSLGVYAPYAVMLACLLYGWALSAFQGDLFEATVTGLKSFIPPLYAMVLIQRPDDSDAVLRSAARAFVFVGPIIGAYGIAQYLALPDWDRYWMLNSPRLTSIGRPEPFYVRVFSTMNSPASFASFATCGLLLFGFCKRGWLSVLLVLPLCVALLLSAVRTAWIVAVIGIVYGCFFHATRGRSVLLALSILAATIVVLLTPYSDLIAERLASLGTSPLQDGSGQERFREYVQLYTDMDRYLMGNGLAGTRAVDSRMLGVDGQLVASAVMMGIFIGNIHVFAVVWAAVQGLIRVDRQAPPVWLAAAAIVLGNIVTLPLMIIASGEVSFPVWMFVALLTAQPRTRQAYSSGQGLRAAGRAVRSPI